MSPARGLLEIVRNNKQFLNPALSYYFSVESTEKLEKVIKYFSTYPLLGIKNLDFQDFAKVYSMIIKGNHLTESEREIIKKIVSKINKNR